MYGLQLTTQCLVCFRPAYARQVCEVDDLVSDLGIDKVKAKLIVDKAKDAQLFEKRKAAVQGTWKAVVRVVGSD